MSRLVLIAIGVDAKGKPDLRLPPDTEITRHGRHFVVEWNEHRLTGVYVGKIATQRYYLAAGDRRILLGLAHLGAAVKRVATLSAARRSALRARGIRMIRRVSDGAIVGVHPEVVWAGEDPIAVGLDGAMAEGESYEVVA